MTAAFTHAILKEDPLSTGSPRWNNGRIDERIEQCNTKHGHHWSLIASDPSTLWHRRSWEHAHTSNRYLLFSQARNGFQITLLHILPFPSGYQNHTFLYTFPRGSSTTVLQLIPVSRWQYGAKLYPLIIDHHYIYWVSFSIYTATYVVEILRVMHM